MSRPGQRGAGCIAGGRRATPRRWVASVGIAAAALSWAGVGGCATSVDRRPLGAATGVQGEAWEVFLPPPIVALEGGEEGAGELSRRDFALNDRPQAALTAADDWPSPTRTTLERPLRLQFSTSERQYLFFRYPSWWRRW